MNAMYDSRAVAAYVAQQCKQKGIYYDGQRIQIFVFCAYGTMMAQQGKLLCDEVPRCWQYGPVFPKVFQYIKKGKQIESYSTEIADGQDEYVKELIIAILVVFGRYNTQALTEWVRKDGSPWKKTCIESKERWNAAIPSEHIFGYFKNIGVLNEQQEQK